MLKSMDINNIASYLATTGVDLLIKIAAALAIWLISRWIIAKLMTLVSRGIAKVANTVDPREAIERLRPAIAAISNVLATPAPEIDILEFTAEGPKLAVRPFTNTANYWQVYFDTNKAIVEVFGTAGYPVPAATVIHK